mmetsp:Transcript_9069/g.11792  ORF Transcript_9069/g.11792 Transcript_9069/m.11792 type:complete len:327 (-) Transcript_9069:1508-2488(-)
MGSKSYVYIVVLRDRRLGKGLRFIDGIKVVENGGIENSIGRKILKLKCTASEKFEGSFPSRRNAIKRGDTIRVKLDRGENIISNGNKLVLWHVSCLDVVKDVPRKSLDSLNLLQRDLGDPRTKSLCKSWINGGKCVNVPCMYRHYILNLEEEERVNRLMKKKKQVKEKESKFQSDYNQDGQHGERQNKRLRAKLFSEWILHHFDISKLTEGSGVVDIAGGKGLVAIELLLQAKSNHVNVAVIDPSARKTKISKHHLKLLGKCNSTLPVFIAKSFDENFHRDIELKTIIQNCSFMFGMHPDQATGSIVQTAIALRKPFAVVVSVAEL